METHHITPARGLSETGLKWVALVTMVLDHIHYFFSFTGCVPEWFSMVGRLGAPLFLFCLVEGFTHTRSRKRYFARVHVLSTAMSLLFFFMAFAHVLVRPDGFYPANGMMTTFVILMVMFQGIDWLGRRHIVRGLAALLLPRHHHVQENAVRPAAVGLAHRPAAVEEGDLVSVPLQGGFQQGAEIPVVVHHQNMGHGYHLSSAEDRAPTTGRRGCKYGRDRRRRTAACGLRPAAHYSTA